MLKIKYLCVACCLLICFMAVAGCNAENTADRNTPVISASADAADTPKPTEATVSTPDENGAIVSAIEGYNSNSAAQGGEVSSNSITLPYTVSDTHLKITAMGGYTGEFVEDSTDLPVSGVFAIVVQNISSAALKSAKIVMTDSSGNTYSFKLSTLPAGTSALVMEGEQSLYSPDIELVSVEASEVYLDTLSLNEDKIKLSFDGQYLLLKNISDTDLTAVYVRFKNFASGNIYLGGITYSAAFDNVKAGEEYAYNTMHLSLDHSEILMVEVIE